MSVNYCRLCHINTDNPAFITSYCSHELTFEPSAFDHEQLRLHFTSRGAPPPAEPVSPANEFARILAEALSPVTGGFIPSEEQPGTGYSASRYRSGEMVPREFGSPWHDEEWPEKEDTE